MHQKRKIYPIPILGIKTKGSKSAKDDIVKSTIPLCRGVLGKTAYVAKIAPPDKIHTIPTTRKQYFAKYFFLREYQKSIGIKRHRNKEKYT